MRVILKIFLLVLSILLVYCSSSDTFIQDKLLTTELTLEQIYFDTTLVDDSLSSSQILDSPFSPTTRMDFILTEKDSVNITLYDLQGVPVTKTLSAFLDPGKYVVRPNLLSLRPGIYLMRFYFGDQLQTKKILVFK
ncbi:MAG: T9SS type A sorting domain-containing protein [Ignavibacteriaceae bacterium]